MTAPPPHPPTPAAPPEPPAVALRILRGLLHGERGEAFVGDLLERFEIDAAHPGGRFGARIAFWREALLAAVLLSSAHRAPTVGAESDMRSFLADLRHASRLLRRAPSFTALCTITLALAIGATTVVFGIVNPLLLRSLPYPHSDRLLTVWERDRDGSPSNVGFATYRDFARAPSLEYAAAIGEWSPTITQGDDAERLHGERVSWTYFRTLGVRPALGRDFVAAEDAPASNHVVILSHGLWARRFGANPLIVGGTISIDGVPYTVAGVMPADFENVLSPTATIWRVLGYDETLPWACRTCRHLNMIARLRSGASRDAALAELERLSSIAVAEHPTEYTNAGVRVIGAQQWVTERLRPILYAVVGAVALLLLLAVANVSSLQLARAMRRENEFAVRIALGAGRGRLARQLLAEGVLLAVLGGVAGIALARVVLPLLVSRLPEQLPRLQDVRLDLPAAGVAAAVTLVLAVVVGLAPVWGRAHVFDALRSGARLAGPRRRVARGALVITEVALALALLEGAGLLSRTLARLLAVDVGFEPAHLLTLEVQATGPRYRTDDAVFANHDLVREAVSAVPGVVGVGLASQLPLGGNVDRMGVHAEDRPLANPQLAPSADRYTVSPDFLRAMRIPMVRGRMFGPEARDSLPKVAIVSAALAQRIWPGENAVGKRIQVGGTDGPWWTVIGVAGNVRHASLDETETQQVYLPERQWREAENQMVLVVRTPGDPAALAPAVRRAVHAVDPTQPIVHVQSMEQVVSASLAQRTLALLLFGTFAGVALLMAVAGIYGVLSGAVAERTRELGLRIALGATPGHVLRRVVGDGGRLAVTGIAIGAAGALAVGRLLGSLLYGVDASDPLTLGGVVVLLLFVAVAACLVPARRAARVDPMTALRSE